MADTHALVMNSNETIDGLTIDGSSYSEALKSSNRYNNRAQNCILIGGSEDCLDIVRGYGTFVNLEFRPTKKTRQSITAKGSCSITLIGCEFHGNPKQADITIGDFTIYDAVQRGRIKSDVNISNCKAFNDDGTERPIKITILHGNLINNSRTKANVKIKKYPSILVKVYFFFGRLFTPKDRKNQARNNLKSHPDIIPAS